MADDDALPRLHVRLPRSRSGSPARGDAGGGSNAGSGAEDVASPWAEAQAGDGGEATDADAGGGDEDADRLGFFGGDTLLAPLRHSLDDAGGAAAEGEAERGGSWHGAHGAHGPPRRAARSSDHGGPVDADDDSAAEARALPFEFRVLDAALDAVCTRLEEGVADVEAAATPALDALTRTVTKRNVEEVKRVRGALARLQARVQTVRAELQRLLDDDSDMRDMYLSRKAAARAAALRMWLGVRTGAAPPHAATPHAATPQHAHAHAHAPHAWELLDADDDADIQARWLAVEG
jgi:hypothetical protein